jgi:hypothetical protein
MPRGDLGPRASHEPGADDTDAYNHAIIRHAIIRHAGSVALRTTRRQRGN